MRDKLIEVLDNSKGKYTIGLAQIADTFDYESHGITRDQFMEICQTFNYALMRTLIETGNTYVLPHQLGTISIRKRKRNNKRAFNLKLFQDTGERTYFNNRHSDGYYARFDWNKKPPITKCININMVKFIPARVHKRFLASKILNENYIVKYFDHD